MKKILFLLLWVNLAFIGVAQAASQTLPPDLFQDDISSWDCALEPLTQLEQHVSISNLTHAQLKQQNHPLVESLFASYSTESILFDPENPDQRYLDVPGFIWGFCCSFVGVLIVSLLIDDSGARKKQTSLSISGCIASCLLLGCFLAAITLIYSN